MQLFQLCCRTINCCSAKKKYRQDFNIAPACSVEIRRCLLSRFEIQNLPGNETRRTVTQPVHPGEAADDVRKSVHTNSSESTRRRQSAVHRSSRF